MKRTLTLFLVSLLWVAPAHSDNVFVVNDIRVEGLQQVDAGNVFRNFPIATGDQVDGAALAAATRQLFRSGFFEDVQLVRENDVLVLVLRERPAVAIIRIEATRPSRKNSYAKV
ncbi:POTRA domain-containing protein [Nitrincola nitratireducens]|uniref:Omp85 n=1 Tax=Nitrincola nitratireducens TaxID=1229521 RepID=W9UXR2_9GAMM|nr:POTRA domain-containing protein [Nitrincola nitratireducens]EXJ12048.1 Omp85 [Nitrincola nitratireducens]